MSAKKVLDRVMLALVVVLSLCVVAVLFGLRISDDGLERKVQVTARVEAAKLVDPSTLPAGTELGYTTLQTTLPNPGGAEDALMVLWQLPSILVAWAVVFLLWRIVRSVANGEPFDSRNVNRLRVIAGVLIAAPVLRLLGGLARGELIERSPIANLDLEPMVLNYSPLFLGLALIILSEVFANGRAQRKDVEGLV